MTGAGLDTDTSERMSLHLLGSIESFDQDGTPVRLPPQQLRLIAFLAVQERPVDRDQIAEYITGSDAKSSAVRVAVHRLRAVVGSLVEQTSGGIRLRLDRENCDLIQFRELIAAASTADDSAQVTLLKQALELWTGPPLGQLGDEHWAMPWVAKLQAQRTQALETLAETLVATDSAGDAIPLLTDHVLANPLQERPTALLMRAYRETGRVADGLRAFQQLNAELTQVGLVPSGEVRRLEHELIMAGSALAPSSGTAVPPQGEVAVTALEIADSAHHWALDPHGMSQSTTDLRQIVDDALLTYNGFTFEERTDGRSAVFATTSDALACVAQVHAQLATHAWFGPQLTVRVGIAHGKPEEHGGRYFGPPVALARRMTSAAHGAQTLVSQQIVDIEPDLDVLDLGVFMLRDIAEPQRVWEVGTTSVGAPLAAALTTVDIPQERTELFGREHNVAGAESLLEASRLVTLVGPGGAGKTALAIHVARKVAPEYPGGVFFADLSPVDDGDSVVGAIAAGLSMPTNVTDIDHVIERVGDRRTLVVVDNCEHVLAEVEPLIDRILDRHPSLCVLATSRESLGIETEQVHRVDPLDTSLGGPACQLFTARAIAARPGIALDDAEIVSAICTQLDGMPLAIEMAAARVRSLSVARLAAGLDDRFHLLTKRTRRARSGKETLEQVIGWSYDLIDEPEQRLFRRLGIFHGGFDIAAATALNGSSEGATLSQLDSLVAKSLVEFVPLGDITRFRLLESLRLFAIDRLVEVDEVVEARSLHARHYASGWLVTPGQPEEEVRAIADWPNVVAAIDWALDEGAEHVEPVVLAKLIALTATRGSYGERNWHRPDAAERFGRLFSLAAGVDFDAEPMLQVPFVNGAIMGCFPSHTDDESLRSSIAGLTELSRRVGTSLSQDSGTVHWLSPMLLVHLSHQLLPHEAARAVDWFGSIAERTPDPATQVVARYYELVGLLFEGKSPSSLLVQLDDLKRRLMGVPGHWHNGVTSSVAYMQLALGDTKRAVDTLSPLTTEITSGSLFESARVVAQAAVALAEGRLGDAMSRFIEQVRNTPFGTAGRETTYLAVFAWARLLGGQATRASELIDHTVKRVASDYLVNCRAKALVEAWPQEEFVARVLEWHEHHERGPLASRIERMAPLLSEELTYWAGQVV